MRKGGPELTSQTRQNGAVAVEFAFVFPLLFLLMYGVIVYAYVFVVQQSLQYAAQEAAEAAVKVNPLAGNADALRASNARMTAARVLRWLPLGQQQHASRVEDVHRQRPVHIHTGQRHGDEGGGGGVCDGVGGWAS